MQNVAAYYAGRSGAGIRQRRPPGRPATNCVICHGATGVSRQPLWPNLAGLSTSYVCRRQILTATVNRKHPSMSAMAKDLSDADTVRLAAFFASTQCK